MITLTCQYCHKSFNPKRDRKIQKYCSYKCLNGAKKLLPIHCKRCDVIFKPKLSKNIYCSVSCAGKSAPVTLKGALNPKWKGGIHRRITGATRKQPTGYIEVWNGHRWIGQHRMFMEVQLNRPLTDNEQVHHINGVRNDNRIDNLVVLTKAQHNHLHKTEQVKTRARDDIGRFS